MHEREKKDHWENIYTSRTPDKLSWAKEQPSPSAEWIMGVVPDKKAGIIDVGGGIAYPCRLSS